MRGSEAGVEVVCSNALSEGVEKASGVKAVRRRTGHAVFVVPSERVGSLEDEFDIGSILDQFWVITDPDPSQNEAMLASFFDEIAPSYGDIIEPTRNRENLRHLLWLLLDHLRIPSDGDLVDFGCGPGTSFEMARDRGRSVVGIDLSRQMRLLAEKVGMEVYAPESAGELQEGHFAGGFASYVLHLDPRPEVLPVVLRRFKPTGVLVANVHKDRGIDTLRRFLDRAGCESFLLPPPTSDIHGSYLAISAHP